MISIEEASRQITRSLQDRYLELKKELNEVNEDISITVKDFRAAAAQGDLRENSAYKEAEDKLTKLSTQKLFILKDIESIELVTSDLKYVPRSYIDLYSTFRLLRDDTQEISTWKVYPGSISDIERGILASEAPIFRLLKGKEVGDIIKSPNRRTGELVKFTVYEIY